MIAEQVRQIISADSLYQAAPRFCVPEYERNRSTIAYHETGHAVCCLVFDIPFTEIAIDGDSLELRGGYVLLDKSRMTRTATLGRDSAMLHASTSAKQMAALALATTWCAGMLAELLVNEKRPFAGVVDNDSSDFQIAKKLLDKEYGSDRPLYACQKLAVLVLEHNWRWVEKIASALDEAGRLSESEVIGLFGQAYPSS